MHIAILLVPAREENDEVDACQAYHSNNGISEQYYLHFVKTNNTSAVEAVMIRKMKHYKNGGEKGRWTNRSESGILKDWSKEKRRSFGGILIDSLLAKAVKMLEFEVPVLNKMS